MDKPTIIQAGTSNVEFNKIIATLTITKTIDLFIAQLGELFEILHPELLRQPTYKVAEESFVLERSSNKDVTCGCWIYFPWSQHLLHVLESKELFLLRTNRNRNLITLEEQQILRSFTVGVVGMSIGSHMAVNLAYSGISDTIKLADFDVLSTSNLNRVRARLEQVGQPKVNIAAEQVYELNPFAQVSVFPIGLKDDNIDNFLSGDSKVQLIFEAIDDFKMKIKLRLAARKARVPVVMLTNLGDSTLIDIERYDLDPQLELFNGLIGSLAEEILDQPITPETIKKYAVQLVGKDNVPPRALASLPEIGKTLVGRPQLQSTVGMSGSLAAYITRRIALGGELSSGRRRIVFDQII
jgi:hypothetical protein